ncbi:hypothetical protein [Bradyrhizobium zhanjiangense]|uniref:Uncharacterized protein n=1 Tax=Bradyrhizobium zhanjiangense TaxID=1325107 RepID=A0A4Q0SN56_9BRAD|nr:hypothetical protein [Bradyrhizobium zhanjiangense]RXH41077.1 hypothetical protein XH94_09550 [Bradyrhizobium zhanjiangense]
MTDLFKQLSAYARIALPFLGIIYAAMLIYYDAPKDRSVYVKQAISIIIYAAMAYFAITAVRS